MGERLELDEVIGLVDTYYLPFADIMRAVPWPGDVERSENDAEHSFSLALIGGVVAERMGLDASRAMTFGLVHDLVELYAGDTPFWDEDRRRTKSAREAAALDRMRQDPQTPDFIMGAIEEYERRDLPEARLIHALDKLLVVIVLMRAKGHLWKTNGITFDMHDEKYRERRKDLAGSPEIQALYDEIHDRIANTPEVFFDN